MKKPIFTFLLVFCFSALFGQSNDLQHVIVMMAERYDDSQLSQKTALMTKEQRRDFVIAERKAYCQASQAQVLDFLEGYKANNMVSDLKTFWSFNGFSCSASAEVIAQLAQRKDVAMIIPDEMRQMIPQNERTSPTSTRANAWHVDKINAPAVWNYNGTGYTGNGVIIGHIDTGVNYNHIDIANSMWDGGSEFPHHGYDIFYQDNDPMDDDGHGTHTAGILAGQGTAGTQTGIAPGAKIMSIKVLGEDGQGEATHPFL